MSVKIGSSSCVVSKTTLYVMLYTMKSLLFIVLLGGCGGSSGNTPTPERTNTVSSVVALPTSTTTSTRVNIPSTAQRHQVRSHVPLSIGESYSCVIVPQAQMEHLKISLIEKQPTTCRQADYALHDSYAGTTTRLFLRIDKPVKLARPHIDKMSIDHLVAYQQTTGQECQIVIDVLPRTPQTVKVPGRNFSVLVSNYGVSSHDRYTCKMAHTVTRYLIPYLLR